MMCVLSVVVVVARTVVVVVVVVVVATLALTLPVTGYPKKFLLP
jgi:hypothetical protein